MVLTHVDLTEINNLLEEKFEEKFRNMPTKDEFFGWMDKLMKELQAIRESQEMLGDRGYEDHEGRISVLEAKVGIGI